MNDGCGLCHLVSAQSARRRKLTYFLEAATATVARASTFFAFEEELSLLDPDLNLACVRAKVGSLEGGDLEF
jgi:hypothetical protein